MLGRKGKKSQFPQYPNLLKLCFFIPICLILSACGSEQKPATNTIQTTSLPTVATVVSSNISDTFSTLSSAPTTLAAPIFTATSISTLIAASSGEWEYSWLNSLPCSAPCWQGIIPGKSTYTDASKILQQLSFVHNFQEDKRIPDPGALWDWGEGSNRSWGEVRYSEKDPQNKIKLVSLAFPKGFKLNDINRVYGEPDYVWVEVQSSYIIRLVYLNHGITLVSDTKNKPTLDGNMFFNFVWFVSSGTLEDYRKSISYSYPLTSLPHWQGYRSFDFYWN